MKPFQNSENNWHNEDVFIASNLSAAVEDNVKFKNNPQTVSSHENAVSHHANENNIAINEEETRPGKNSSTFLQCSFMESRSQETRVLLSCS